MQPFPDPLSGLRPLPGRSMHSLHPTDNPLLYWSAFYAYFVSADPVGRKTLDHVLNDAMNLGCEVNPVAEILRSDFNPPVLSRENVPDLDNYQTLWNAVSHFSQTNHIAHPQKICYILCQIRLYAYAARGRRPLFRRVDTPKPLDPPLSWLGKKTSLVPWIRGALSYFAAAKRLVEPFVGSGAVFLNAGYQSYLLGDYNPYVINFYRQIQNWGGPVAAIAAMEEIYKSRSITLLPEKEESDGIFPLPGTGLLEFKSTDKPDVAELKRRSQENAGQSYTFNRELSFGHMSQAITNADPENQAHMFLHLNKESVLGQMKLLDQAKKLRNVNKRTGLQDLAEGSLHGNLTTAQATQFPGNKLDSLAKRIHSANITFVHQDYRETLMQASPGDVIYCDPPYFGTEGVYGAGFGNADQNEFVGLVSKKAFLDGVPVVVSNLFTEKQKPLPASRCLDLRNICTYAGQERDTEA